VGLIETLLEQSSDVDDRVIHPFMRSATTAVAAIQNDRDYVGFEVAEPNYRKIVERRIGEAKRHREASVNSDAE
jgi:site-specific DNA-methyltransferase (adenine-specific)